MVHSCIAKSDPLEQKALNPEIASGLIARDERSQASDGLLREKITITDINPLKWEVFKEPYPIENGVLTIPDKPGFGVEFIDDIEKKFPWKPGPYYKTNPVFEGLDLPIWWS
jgi:hypothetical protein